MTPKSSASVAAKKKLLSRIAAAQRQADSAKKAAKLAKLNYRTAKDKFKAAKHAAKKARKVVKGLKAELAASLTKKVPAKRRSTKPAARKPKPRPMPAPISVPAPAPVENAPVLPEVPSQNPV
jgi:hypothetical protein